MGQNSELLSTLGESYGFEVADVVRKAGYPEDIWIALQQVQDAPRHSGRPEQHDYQLYFAINDIDHTKTKAKSPQANGICERFHKIIHDEFYCVAFRKKAYENLESLQRDLDA